VEGNNYTIKCTGGKAEECEGGVEGVDPQDCFLLVSIQKFNHVTYLLTPWSRVLLEKLTSKLCE